MRLKRLELYGFKSFADRTVFEYPHPFTGIVGPNGCGKSNVVDAVRWVLGETRPTSMRGGEMTDVIFKGSSSRPGLGVAEVTLVLDNECGSIAAHGAEVAVTRRVFKSGEGEYEIDGSRVRLKDVKDLLFDTGLGSRGYAVLEQGRIDAVLSANPQDRRSIFEEAAGISRYRQRRKETESKLKRVDADLERADDVLRELQSRSRSLKIQAGKAERWVAARDAWTERGTLLAASQALVHDRELAELRAQRGALRVSTDTLRGEREAGEAEVAAKSAALDRLAEQVDERADQVARLSGDLRAIEERREQLGARVAAWRASADAERRRTEELGVRLGERRDEFATLAEETDGARARGEAAEAGLEAQSEVVRETDRRYREARAESQDQSATVNERLHERAASHNAVQHLQAQLEPLEARSERAVARLADARERLADARTEASQSERSLDDARAATESAEAHRADAARRADEAAGRARALDEERERLAVERASLEARVAGLRDWERDRDALEQGERALLEPDTAEGAEPRPAARLRGLLADHLHVESRFARALDVALGDRAHALVLEDAEAAEALGSWLRGGRLGQARLVTLDALNAGRCEPGLPELPYGLRDRVLGALSDQVTVAPDLVGVARVLLCDCVLVEDLASALALAEHLPGWRLVTPDGDLVDAAGVTVGWREVAQGPVGRRSEATELEARVAELVDRRAALDEDAADAARSRRAVAVELEGAAATLEERRSGVARLEARVAAAARRLEDAERQLTQAEEESRGVLEERARLEAELVAARERAEQATRRFEAENARLAELERARHEREAEREEAARAEGRARVERTRIEESLQGLDRRRADLERGIEELESEIRRTEHLASDHARSAASGDDEVRELGARGAALEAEKRASETELGRLREAEREGRAGLEERRRAVEALTTRLEADLSELSDRQLAVQRVELALDELLRRAQEDLALDRAGLGAALEHVDAVTEREALAALTGEVVELRRELDRLGPVNLEAVEELEAVTERLDFLETQRKDLVESRAELARTLERINTESERLFVEAFEEIRGHFRTIFRQLFGGGRADVVLEEGLPVLEAGIEIVARPPGREALPIGLLSGGQRTMTALALLFAVFQSRPSPFCVLDEVDAALDDANVGRFLAMLDGFLEQSQFVVVTHNKGTMAAADRLYGVTMETKGVSTRVAVELSDVDAFVPEAIGDADESARARGEAAVDEAGRDEDDGADEPLLELVPQPRRDREAPAAAARD